MIIISMENQDILNKRIKFKHQRKTKKCKLKIFFLAFIISFIILLIIFIVLYLFFPKTKDKNKIIPKSEWNYKPAGDKIKTRWAYNLDPYKVWQEYPRPQLQREDWINLNGPWKYSIRTSSSSFPDYYDGFILVPFPIESSLSGVMKTFNNNDVLWYEKEIEIPKKWKGKHILLNFGAVDWKCELFMNKIKVGEHIGGYSYFYFDITNYLNKGKNEIILKVIDPSDDSYQPRGKQTLNPEKIWYTSSSGIWQTVWLEPVNENYIEKLEINNDYDNQEIKILFKVANNNNNELTIAYSVKFNDKLVGEHKGKINEYIPIKLSNEDFKPWSPSEPNIYLIEAKLLSHSGDVLDKITSYTTIRKIESKKDKKGILRIFLNNKPLFNLGTLDQGFWPDGLYTPPSEEAMLYDINQLKNLGFNTIRKHVKVESFRYYYQCDKIGIMIWQDMPSGNINGFRGWDRKNINGGSDTQRTQESKDNYYKEWGDIIENLKFFQCIIVWVPFNEAWGQFDTLNVVEFTKNKDNSRLINAASGGNHRICGNFLDLHSYPNPIYFLNYDKLINVFGEFGGLGLKIRNHMWTENNWGYVVLSDKKEVTKTFIKYIKFLIELAPKGISAAIYTQTTDVEAEINGLITYDRYEIKVSDEIKLYNQELISILKE